MTEKQKIVEGFFDDEGFTERIIIGLYNGQRIYFHVDFSDELANGLISMALADDNVHQGIKLLIHNLKAVIDGVGEIKPETDEVIH